MFGSVKGRMSSFFLTKSGNQTWKNSTLSSFMIIPNGAEHLICENRGQALKFERFTKVYELLI